MAAYLAFSPDGKVLAASSQQDGQICLLDMAIGKELPGSTGPQASRPWRSRPTARSWRRGSSRAKKLDATTPSGCGTWPRRDLCRVKAHRSGTSALAFSPDGRRLLSARADATALVWDVAALTEQQSTPAADVQSHEYRSQ